MNATTAADGKTYQVESSDLDAILSVCDCIDSKRGTPLRVWTARALGDRILSTSSVAIGATPRLACDHDPSGDR